MRWPPPAPPAPAPMPPVPPVPLELTDPPAPAVPPAELLVDELLELVALVAPGAEASPTLFSPQFVSTIRHRRSVTGRHARIARRAPRKLFVLVIRPPSWLLGPVPTEREQSVCRLPEPGLGGAP